MSSYSQRGVTLLELMIVVAIVGILAAIAVPSFNEQVVKSRRADARNSLFDWQLRQAEYFADNLSYGSVATVSGGASNTVDSVEGYYELTVISSSASSFQMKATPVSGGSQAGDTECGSYFCINQDGPFDTLTGCADLMTCW